MAFADAQANAVITYGADPIQGRLGGTVTKGDAVGKSGGKWVRALATTGGVIQLSAVAGEEGVDGQTITIYTGITIIEGSRFSGATAGGALYVAEGTSSGQYTQTAPTTTGDANTIVGYALSATKGVVLPRFNVDSVA